MKTLLVTVGLLLGTALWVPPVQAYCCGCFCMGWCDCGCYWCRLGEINPGDLQSASVLPDGTVSMRGLTQELVAQTQKLNMPANALLTARRYLADTPVQLQVACFGRALKAVS